MEVTLLLIVFISLLLLRVPIAFAIGISALVLIGIKLPSIEALTTVAQRMATGLNSFTLLAIPLFVIAGEIMNRGGIAKRLINFAKSIFGFFPGGMAAINILGNMLFGAISGSAAASASAIGGIMKKPLEDTGYSKEFGAAVNITSSTTGLIIPPSNTLIIYSLASGGTSIAALFLAGYIPGILIGLVLVMFAVIYAKRNKIKTDTKASFKTFVTSFIDAIPSFSILVIVIGGIVGGFFTATESSAIAVAYALLISVFLYKEISFKDLPEILLASMKTTGIVLLLVSCSMALSWALSYNNIPQDMAEALLSISDNKYVVLILINILLLFIGIFMDITPAVLIFTPIFLPAMEKFGVSPVHFGIIMVLNLCIGLCTPPVGSLLFVGCSVAEIKIQSVVKTLIPFFLGMIAVLLAVTFIPALSLWLPELFGF